jgi:DNA-binding NtrC family response regulator
VNSNLNPLSGHREQVRILFVDDEPLVLEGLRRSVDREFLVDLASGAEEGLAKLRSAGPYAVVVSDMRMSSMDGAEFLATVGAVSPDSVRVMLGGAAISNPPSALSIRGAFSAS